LSLASDYSTAYAAAEEAKANIVAEKPASFSGPNGTAEVTIDGQLHLIQTTSGDFTISGAGALAFATWINNTFGG